MSSRADIHRAAVLAAILVFAGLSPAISAGPAPAPPQPFVVVLGIAQDAGYPHAGCQRACCLRASRNRSLRRHVSSVAIVDPASGERWIVDATPDFTEQLARLNRIQPTTAVPAPRTSSISENLGLSGVLLTHAHIGHYTGLMFLGREGIGSRRVPVYAMPRMREYLTRNGPWSQLVALENIELRPLEAGTSVRLNARITVTPLLVPHRDEFSETVGFVVKGPSRSVLYLPDIDKWERWDRRIEEVVATVDRAYVDGSFFADGEVPGRSMAEIPHPFVTETMERLRGLARRDRAKVRFIHLNHTNPALVPGSAAEQRIRRLGFGVAEEGERVVL